MNCSSRMSEINSKTSIVLTSIVFSSSKSLKLIISFHPQSIYIKQHFLLYLWIVVVELYVQHLLTLKIESIQSGIKHSNCKEICSNTKLRAIILLNLSPVTVGNEELHLEVRIAEDNGGPENTAPTRLLGQVVIPVNGLRD